MLSWLGAGAMVTTGSGAVDEEGVATVLAQSSGDVGGMIMAAVALLVLGLAGVAVWRADLPSLLSRLDEGETEVESAGATQPPTETEPAAPTPEAEPEVEAASENEELTDREEVVRILDDNEGRMKQARIVDETGWSKSKVSMLLSEMEDDEEISKLRVGRENIISLSGNEPEAAGSPFDDE
jgi:uncharacterized membrane protein